MQIFRSAATIELYYPLFCNLLLGFVMEALNIGSKPRFFSPLEIEVFWRKLSETSNYPNKKSNL